MTEAEVEELVKEAMLGVVDMIKVIINTNGAEGMTI